MQVFQYIRISDKDQSNCSIDGQQRFNQLFAEKNGMHIIETFIDDGVSAKNFNRPEWRKLEEKLKKRKAKGVIVWKYDRLIRNVMEGLAFLDRAEKEYGVTIYSAMETFSINPFDPMFFKIRADILVNGEYERRIITDRTNFGIWSAKMQGKYVGSAPYGYINARDERNKPIILVDESKRHIIEYIFNAFSIGQSATRIQHVANEMGMNRKGHDAIRSVVSNPVYKGYILAPAYKGADEKLVKGIHEQLIDEETWDKCQIHLKDNKVRSIISPELPLRGLVRCSECGDIMTGSRSKGRSSYYHYYRCFNCKNVNINTQKVEKTIQNILNAMSLPKEVLQSAETKFIETMTKQIEINKKERSSVLLKIQAVKEKKESLELKYFDNKIDHATYTTWHDRFVKELMILESDLEYLTNKKQVTPTYIKSNIKHLSKLGYIYSIAAPIEKQELCSHIFASNLYISNRQYRTAKNALLSTLISKKINELETLNLEELDSLYERSPGSTPTRSIIEPNILSLMEIISKITA